MKKMLLFFAFFAAITAKAQKPFLVFDSVDINKYHFPVSVHGNMLAGYYLSNQGPKPTDTSLFWITRTDYPTLFQRIWISGYDAANNLKLSSQTYYWKDSATFWPGPLNTSAPIDYTTSGNWARIWKVTNSDIQNFQAQVWHTVTNTPSAILTWPGKGNIYATGRDGVTLNITRDMAPFVDVNNNGIYDPLHGDYPDFPGDQALWWVFNDDGPNHKFYSGQPLHIEVHAMAYGYNRGTLIDNIAYVDYKIINRSSNSYHDVRLTNFNDMDLGWYLDDYIGFDSARRMGILYNGTNDDGGGGGHPVNQYWGNPAMYGTALISLPNDETNNCVPAGSFVYYNNDWSFIGNPENAEECNNYMRARMRNGQHFNNDYTGIGIPSNGTGTGYACNYVFTSDPSDPTGWSECACNNSPGDRRYILSTNDFTLNAGSSQHVVMAYMRTDTPDGGCPNASFAKIREVADTAWHAYYHPPAPLHKGVQTTGANALYAYPTLLTTSYI